jgi:hypothetical protein
MKIMKMLRRIIQVVVVPLKSEGSHRGWLEMNNPKAYLNMPDAFEVFLNVYVPLMSYASSL